MLKYLKIRFPAFFLCQTVDWEADPLSHPDIQNMSMHALADLPLDPPSTPLGYREKTKSYSSDVSKERQRNPVSSPDDEYLLEFSKN